MSLINSAGVAPQSLVTVMSLVFILLVNTTSGASAVTTLFSPPVVVKPGTVTSSTVYSASEISSLYLGNSILPFHSLPSFGSMVNVYLSFEYFLFVKLNFTELVLIPPSHFLVTFAVNVFLDALVTVLVIVS